VAASAAAVYNQRTQARANVLSSSCPSQPKVVPLNRKLSLSSPNRCPSQPLSLSTIVPRAQALRASEPPSVAPPGADRTTVLRGLVRTVGVPGGRRGTGITRTPRCAALRKVWVRTLTARPADAAAQASGAMALLVQASLVLDRG
jgi:hypothetical protein